MGSVVIMKSNTKGKSKKAGNGKKYAEEELKLKSKTLSKTAPGTDRETKSMETVEAPGKGGMKPIGKETRVRPPSGKGIDHEALALRDKTLANTAPDIDPKKKRVAQVTAPKRGGMKKS